MFDTLLTIRPAVPADLSLLHPIIERAYRGDSARAGWTHEADILEGQRTDIAALEAIIASPSERLLVAERDGVLIGCVQISNKGAGLAYLGLLCIDPLLQANGLGKQIIAEAEVQAIRLFGARRMEMTVIERRGELIAYYMRRGYLPNGERQDFPISLDPPLFMTVLVKDLSASR